MPTIKRKRGDSWRIGFFIRYVDEYDEPLVPQPTLTLTTSTFRSTLRDSFNGAVLWTSAPGDIAVIDAPGGIVEVLVPKATTATLAVGATKPVEYVIDLEVTTATGFTETVEVIQVLVAPDVSQ